ncbi:MAG: Unknown protein [uncultured Sulfurovum sp.]|uniref:Peptidase S24/S26A/S26B/S26C domain-containing protein n=1 Tax=uncultured Sulfurovum sp. TaxID=269237 RepID=A0A6S6UF46_9BACT|nr:MAG: Unknown protein [uncultured Sulfurovum sp.]
MLQLFKISGDSLYPFLKNGERVICRKIFASTKIKVDDMIVFQKKSHGLMVKKVKHIEKNGYFVEGTNPYSIDSRDFGHLSQKELQYKVIFKF